MADSDIPAALRAIRSELEVSGATYADESRLLRLAEGAQDLVDRWNRQSTTDYDATAQCARELRRVLEENLLGEEGGLMGQCPRPHPAKAPNVSRQLGEGRSNV